VTRITEVPGRRPLELAHLVLDVNGTLTDRGELIDDVEAQLRKLQETMDVHLVSADTFGSLGRIASIIGVDSNVVDDGVQKASFVGQLGAHRHRLPVDRGRTPAPPRRPGARGDVAPVGGGRLR
jgi:soluble P-type ATPase